MQFRLFLPTCQLAEGQSQRRQFALHDGAESSAPQTLSVESAMLLFAARSARKLGTDPNRSTECPARYEDRCAALEHSTLLNWSSAGGNVLEASSGPLCKAGRYPGAPRPESQIKPTQSRS